MREEAVTSNVHIFLFVHIFLNPPFASSNSAGVYGEMLCKALGFTRPHGAGVRGETSRHLRLRVSSSSSFFFSL